RLGTRPMKPGKNPVRGGQHLTHEQISSSPTHQRDELHKADFRVHFHVELLIQRLRLAAANKHEETIPIEGLYRTLELFLPINFPFRLELVTIEHTLGSRRLDQTAEIFWLALVVILNLLINASADQLTHSHALG